MRWHHEVFWPWEDRWVFYGGALRNSGNELRVMRRAGEDWQVRFDGKDAEATRATYPRELPIEDVKAAALAIWRMR